MPRRSQGGSGTSTRRKLSRKEWLKVARGELIRRGIASVTINALAKRLKVTRESFYWYFKSRDALLDELLRHWEQANNAGFEEALKRKKGRGLSEFKIIAHDVWVSGKGYSAAFDTAMRDWGRSSRKAAASVKRIDGRRIEILRSVYLHLGYSDPEALVRARVAYFNQVGYYTLGLIEDEKVRLKLLPYYMSILTGIPLKQLKSQLLDLGGPLRAPAARAPRPLLTRTGKSFTPA